jgi:hypothetical protein
VLETGDCRKDLKKALDDLTETVNNDKKELKDKVADANIADH